MPARRPEIRLVIADAGPLISLAAAERLDLLQCFDKPVKILDVVKEECLRKLNAPGEAELRRWFTSNSFPAEIIDSPFLPLYRQALANEEAGTDPYASEGFGDAAISWLIAKIPRLYGPNVISLVLTEDAAFGNLALARDVHVLSTRPFLAALENFKIIPSARAVLDDIAAAGRTVSRYQVDRPALTGPKASLRTQWASSLKKPPDRK